MSVKMRSFLLIIVLLINLSACGTYKNQPMAVINNGGAVIQNGKNIYYITNDLNYENYDAKGALYSLDANNANNASHRLADVGGCHIWANGNYLYTSSDYSSDLTYRINPSDGETTLLFMGHIIYWESGDDIFYYFGYDASDKDGIKDCGIYKFNIDTLQSEMIASGEQAVIKFLTKIDKRLYYSTTTEDNLTTIHYYDMKIGKSSVLTTEKPEMAEDQLWLPEYTFKVPKLSACGEWLIYSVGSYQGSGSFFFGELYRIKPDGSEKTVMDITNIDQFFVYDDWLLYFEDPNTNYNPTNIIMHPDSQVIQKIDKYFKIITFAPDGWVFYNTQNGDIHRCKINGEKDTLVVAANTLPNHLAEYDRYFYSIDIVGDYIYFNAQVWGNRAGYSWRDQFIDSSYNRIKLNGTEYQTLNQIKSPLAGE